MRKERGEHRGRAVRRHWRTPVGAIAITALAAIRVSAPAAAQSSVAAWPFSGQNIHNTRDAPDEHQVGPSDVSRLAPRWVFTTDGNVTTTPAVVDGIVYVPDYGGSLWAINAATGKVAWKHKISEYSGIPGDVSRTTPAYWEGQLIIGQGVQTAHN